MLKEIAPGGESGDERIRLAAEHGLYRAGEREIGGLRVAGDIGTPRTIYGDGGSRIVPRAAQVSAVNHQISDGIEFHDERIAAAAQRWGMDATSGKLVEAVEPAI